MTQQAVAAECPDAAAADSCCGCCYSSKLRLPMHVAVTIMTSVDVDYVVLMAASAVAW